MFSLFKKSTPSRDTKQVAFIDVGSASVGAATARLDRNGPPRLSSETRVNLPIELHRQGPRLEADTLKSFREALIKLRDENARLRPSGQAIEHIAIFLPAPWCTLHLSTVRYKHHTNLRVHPGVLERLVADHIAQEHPPKDTDEIIERSAVGIRLNGYAVHDIPQKADATSIEISMISTAANRAFLNSMRAAIREVFDGLPFSFHSSSVAAAYAISVLNPSAHDFLLCNAEGEITELLRVTEHTPVGSATATEGCNAIIRTLRAHAGMDRREIVSALKLAQKEAPLKPHLHSTLISAKYKCAETFRGAAMELIVQTSAPKTLYVAGPDPEAAIFAEAIEHAPFLKTLFPRGLRVEVVGEGLIGTKILRESSSGKKELDVLFSLEAIFLDARFDARRTFNFRLGKKSLAEA